MKTKPNPKVKDLPLKMQIEGQIMGLRNHLKNLQESHHRVETNSRRALGHAQEAIRLALKLRRLYAFNASNDAPKEEVKKNP